jgi:hypothetical protein
MFCAHYHSHNFAHPDENQFGGDNETCKKLIMCMTNYKANDRPDLDILLKDKENYPLLFEKHQRVLEGKYMSQIDLNKL